MIKIADLVLLAVVLLAVIVFLLAVLVGHKVGWLRLLNAVLIVAIVVFVVMTLSRPDVQIVLEGWFR